MADGNTIHMVKGAASSSTANAGSAASAAGARAPSNPTTSPTRAANPFAALLNPAAGAMPNPFGAANPMQAGMGQAGNPMNNAMAPMLAQMMSNPALMQQLMAMDPRYRNIDVFFKCLLHVLLWMKEWLK